MSEVNILEKAELKDAVNEAIRGSGLATMSDVDARLRQLGEPTKVSPRAEEAIMEEGALAGIMKTDVMGVPLGQAAVGGFIAIFATELIDGLLPAQPPMVKGLAKLVGAGAMVKWGGKLVGREAAKIVALLMTFDAIRDLTPLDKWASGLANSVSGIIPVGGLGGQTGQGGGAVRQAEQVVGGYYEGLYGGRR